MINLSKILKVASTILIIWYVFLCIVHLIYQRPLWNDEACVFQSIQYLKPSELFTIELRALQVFPRVYLFLIQQFSSLFDFSLWSLRLPAFICMMIAFLLWQNIARRELMSNWARLSYLLTWSASVPLIYYSAELKQYSMDVMLSGVFVMFLYHQERLAASGKKIYFLCLVLLPLTAFFSYPAFLLCSLPMINLIFSVYRQKTRQAYAALGIYVVVCMMVAVLSYFFDMRLRPTEVLTREWGTYFISTESIGKFFETWWEGTDNLFTRWQADHPKIMRKFGRAVMAMALITFAATLRGSWRREKMVRGVTLVAAVIWIELIAMGILHKYPYTVPRTSLFFAPMALMFVLIGIEKFGQRYIGPGRLLKLLYTGYLIFLAAAIGRVVLTQYLGAQSAIF